MRARLIAIGIIVAAIIGISVGTHQTTPTANLNTTPSSSQTVDSSNASTPSSAATDTTAAPTTTQNSTPTPAVTAPAPATTNTGTSDTNLSNTNTYTNVDGNTVHSPAASTDGTIPAGATAQCVDGTYSFSQHHSGTCSGHGGVAQWL